MKMTKNFKAAKLKMAENQMRALEEIGITITAEAQARAPVDSGRLRRDISHAVGDGEVQIGTNVEYATAVEMGTSKMKAQPFLKDSFIQNTDAIQKIVSKVMGEI